jgi:hypothetical protein
MKTYQDIKSAAARAGLFDYEVQQASSTHDRSVPSQDLTYQSITLSSIQTIRMIPKHPGGFFIGGAWH